MSLASRILGRRLANREQAERRIGAFEGVPAMGLDGLGSSSYGPEAALSVLIPLGVAGLAHFVPIIAAIVALLVILFFSYRQTIAAYPNNGGAYIVSRENLGRNMSLLAAAALMVDYVLNVAVGISAGVGALVSAVPALHPHILSLCLGILALVTVANLRGTLDAGRLFALPTYLFVASFAVILGVGTWHLLAGDAPRVTAAVDAATAANSAGLASIWLLMHAFASGCTAMTGVEAVSNGMSAFKEPRVKYGRRTLAAICVILGLLLAGIAFLVHRYGVLARDQAQPGYESVLSQIAHAAVGGGAFYYIAIGSLLCVLALSANTSFVDFPRMCRMVAADGFLPKPFAVVGRRLVFSVGILYLALTAGLLLIVFGGITDQLIPLFAVGAFLTFTLSQTGMVVHWRRELRNLRDASQRRRIRLHLAINALGAITTAVALLVIVVAKFTEGAWITVLVIPAVILLLRSIRRYYDGLERLMRKAGPLSLASGEGPVVLVVTEGWNQLADKAMAFALQLSRNVLAVHVNALQGYDEDENPIREQWQADVVQPARAAGVEPPRLVLLRSELRLMHAPLLELIRKLEGEFVNRTIAVLLPEVVKKTWWQFLLHTHRARRLHGKLLRDGGSHLVVVSVPWHIEEATAWSPAIGWRLSWARARGSG